MLARNSVGGLVGGGIIIWSGASCPAGYTRLTAIDGKFLVGGASYNAAAGGAASHSHNLPAHTHSLSSGGTGSGIPTVGIGGGFSPLMDSPGHSHGAGSGTSGSAGAATTDSQSNSPLFAKVILCQKD